MIVFFRTLSINVLGMLSDHYGSYNIAFHVAGIPIISGAVILFLIPWAQRTGRSTNIMTAAKSYNVMAPSPSTGLGLDGTGAVALIPPEETIDSPDSLTPSTPDSTDSVITVKSRDSFIMLNLSQSGYERFELSEAEYAEAR